MKIIAGMALLISSWSYAIEICNKLSANQQANLKCYNANRMMINDLKTCKSDKESLVLSNCSTISGVTEFKCLHGTRAIKAGEKGKLLVELDRQMAPKLRCGAKDDLTDGLLEPKAADILPPENQPEAAH